VEQKILKPSQGHERFFTLAVTMKDDSKTREQLINELVRFKKSNESYRSLLAHIPDIAWTSDKDYRIIYVSPAVQMITGYTYEEECHKRDWLTWYDRVHPDDAKYAKESFQELILGGEHYDIEYRFRRKDGSWIWLNDRSVTTYEKDGVTYADGLTSDVTKRKQSELKIRELKDKYETLIRNVPVTVYSSLPDQTSTMLFVSSRWEEWTGYSPDDSYQDPKMWLKSIHPEDREIAAQAYIEAYEQVKEYDFEYRIVHKDTGQIRYVRDHCIPIRNDRGKAVMLDGIITDITEHKKAEVERRELEQKAQVTSRLASIGEMASGIAHEINNPLTSIIGLSELLMHKDSSQDTLEYMEIIHEAAQRVAGISDRLLTFARQRKPERKCTNINEIIENSLALRTYQLETHNIKVITRLSRRLPRTMADAGQLQQVFLNVIINAEKEMSSIRGGGLLTVRTRKIDNMIQVSFKDNGPGIAPGNLERIFDPFFTTRELGEGSGLGLSVCHGIIIEHNGYINAKSRLGKGATFFIELPVACAEG